MATCSVTFKPFNSTVHVPMGTLVLEAVQQAELELNMPCGGSQNGRCEIDPDVPCAWQLIWERMTALGQIDRLLELQPVRSRIDAGLNLLFARAQRQPRPFAIW